MNTDEQVRDIAMQTGLHESQIRQVMDAPPLEPLTSLGVGNLPTPKVDLPADPNLPAHMRPGMIYKGKDGKWYHPDGQLVSRAGRRKAGVR